MRVQKYPGLRVEIYPGTTAAFHAGGLSASVADGVRGQSRNSGGAGRYSDPECRGGARLSISRERDEIFHMRGAFSVADPGGEIRRVRRIPALGYGNQRSTSSSMMYSSPSCHT
jgi:hypothetical protein